jgi:hypothetical protein
VPGNGLLRRHGLVYKEFWLLTTPCLAIYLLREESLLIEAHGLIKIRHPPGYAGKWAYVRGWSYTKGGYYAPDNTVRKNRIQRRMEDVLSFADGWLIKSPGKREQKDSIAWFEQ